MTQPRTPDTALRSILEGKEENYTCNLRPYRVEGMEVRAYILHASLVVEWVIDDLLMHLLGVVDRKLINLNFDAQIKFIKAIGVVTDDSVYIDAFRVVRNRFIHHKDIPTYTKCYSPLSQQRSIVLALLDSESKRLGIQIPSNSTEEERLGFATRVLVDRVLRICHSVTAIALKRGRDKFEMEISHRVIGAVEEILSEPFGAFTLSVSKGSQGTYTRDEVAEIISNLHSLVRTNIATRRLIEAFAEENQDGQALKSDPQT